MATETAIIAGGCFWGAQELLRARPGIHSTRVGYSGGEVPNATYRNHGDHAEAVEVVFDPDAAPAPTLEVVSTRTVGFHPSWLTAHPNDPTLVFTGLEQGEGRVVAIRFDADGHGTVVGTAPSGGVDPCSLLATEKELLVGNVRVVPSFVRARRSSQA